MLFPLVAVATRDSGASGPGIKEVHLSAAWVRAKAASMREAWVRQYGREPTAREVGLSLLSPIVETGAGDAKGLWAGKHDWGAILLRVATRAEVNAMAVDPKKRQSKVALANLLATGMQVPMTPGPGGAPAVLSADYGPRGYYWAWFRAYADDVSGAQEWLRVALGKQLQRSAAVVVLRGGTPAELAHALKAQHYYYLAEPKYARALEARWPSVKRALGIV